MDENKNQHTENQNSQSYELHDLLIKQQNLMLQQFEAMAKLQQKQDEKEDEIDLTRLLPGFLKKKTKEEILLQAASDQSKNEIPEKSLLRIAYHFVVDIYTRSIKRFSIIVVSLAVIFASIGIYKYYTAEKIYSSTMMLDSGNLDASFFEGLVTSLGKLATSNSAGELARKLNITKEQADLITNLYFSNYRGFSVIDQKKTDSTEAVIIYPFFTITVYTKDNSVLPALNKNLFTYLDENPFVKEARQVKQTILKETISNYTTQLSSIDSLKNAIVSRVSKRKSNDQYFVKETNNAGGGLILSQEEPLDMSPMMPFERSLNVQALQTKAKEDLLKLDSDFKIIDDFSAIPQPAFPRVRGIIYFSFYGFVLGSIIAFFLVVFLPKKQQD
jgi:hypothetical protein